jgi:hypothetical protein
MRRAAVRRQLIAQELFDKSVKLLLRQAPDIEPSGTKGDDDGT